MHGAIRSGWNGWAWDGCVSETEAGRVSASRELLHLAGVVHLMDIGRIYGKNEIKSKKLNGTYTYFYDDFLHPYFSYFVTIYKRRSLNV